MTKEKRELCNDSEYFRLEFKSVKWIKSFALSARSIFLPKILSVSNDFISSIISSYSFVTVSNILDICDLQSLESKKNHLKKFHLLIKLPHKWCAQMLHGQNGHMHISSVLNRSSAISRKNPDAVRSGRLPKATGRLWIRKDRPYLEMRRQGFSSK